MNNTEFKVRDTVWCVARGKGVITAINCNDTYPVFASFNGVGADYYTRDGEMYVGGPRCLFFSEPKVEASVTRPFEPTLNGKKVLIVTNGESCIETVFQETEDKLYVNAQGNYWGKKDIIELYEVGANLLDKSEANN